MKETVVDLDSVAPFAPRTPDEPPGIVTTTCDDGTSGELSWYVRVSLPERTHLPPKAGDSWGVTLPRATGAENVTEIGRVRRDVLCTGRRG